MEQLSLLAVLLGTLASSPEIVFEKITDNTQNPPGVSGTLIIGDRSVPCQGSVFFSGSTLEDFRGGLYSASASGLQVIANATILVPGSTETFQFATDQKCAANHLFFIGNDDLTPGTGNSVYSYTKGVIEPFLEKSTPIGIGHFESFTYLSANTTGVVLDARVFPASVDQVLAFKPFDGPTVIVADLTMILPGQTDPVTILSRPILAGPEVFFHARTQQQVGIYRWREDAGISLVADMGTPVPLVGQGNFVGFGPFTYLDGRIIFEAFHSGGFGLFAFDGSDLEPYVLPGEVTAEGATLTSARIPRGEGSLLSFTGQTADNPWDAIFVKIGDEPIRRLMGIRDVVEGREVHFIESEANRTNVIVWAESLDDPRTQFLFRARLLPLADIPALSGYGALVFGFLLALAAVKRTAR